MGRKKKKVVKPWCWYCNREFEDDKVLIQHQKAKHFKCHVCYKKLYTGPGLAVHCQSVHKETIDKIPNSLPGRGSTELEIFGMEGIPEADVKKHEAEVLGKTDDEPEDKKAKILGGPMMPGGMYMPMMPMVPGMRMPPMPGMPMMPNMPFASMMPGMAPMAAPIRPPMPPIVAPVVGSSSSTLAAGPSSETTTNGTAVQQQQATAARNAALILQTSGTKILHPDEDISLEERRATFPQYAPATRSSAKLAKAMGLGTSAAGAVPGMLKPTPAGGPTATMPIMPTMSATMPGYPAYYGRPMTMAGMPAPYGYAPYGYPPMPPQPPMAPGAPRF